MTHFRISLRPDHLDRGSREEQVAFGLISISAGGILLSEGFDNLVEIRREGPLVSGYHLAEWLLANWWRLRYEPRPFGPTTDDWQMSHLMSEIGEGYVWPIISISSDGYRSIIQAKPSDRGEFSSFRYYGASQPAILPWSSVERGIDDFVDTVLALADEGALRDSNLSRLQRELSIERKDQDTARYRQLEAILGRDPDELPEELIYSIIEDQLLLGEDGVNELAAAASQTDDVSMLRSCDIYDIAKEHGVELQSHNALSIDKGKIAAPSEEKSAAEVGVNAARVARAQINKVSGPLDDRALADITGVPIHLLESSSQKLPVSFTLDQSDLGERAVLRGTRKENRRFDLARLLGDRLIWRDSWMRPSTDTKTYRQKAQRAFAAEFLSPIFSVIGEANGNYSEQKKEDLAEHFKVSPMVIDRILKNNQIIDRDPSDFEDAA